MSNEDYYDITVVGGGPVGLFAATYACMRQAKTQIIESLDKLGGQVTNLFPAKKIYDIPAFSSIKGNALINELVQQVQQFAPQIFLNEKVQEISKTASGFKLVTNLRTTYSRTIIIATGVGAFQPRKLALPNANSFENQQLLYSISDPEKFANKDVMIAGGGDSAVDWALELAPFAKTLHIVHRRSKFRALEANVARLHETQTIFDTPYLITDLQKGADTKIKVTLKKVKEDSTTQLRADYLLVNYGFVTDTKILQDWNLETQHNLLQVSPNMQTSTPGIYAAGDIIDYAGRVNLIATGFGEAPIAVNSAMHYLNPDLRQPAHSTQLIKKFPKIK
ncbi:NAD(P)/FAD-dependent oxidoreductase [Liquorilactobacillus satsumensis]|uniref:NAD(P)/FAD-dependent oxidoreductase n=1 Tax=Liquorilactobacillus satsumensis TaxID=259059 RepID=UPI0021C38664|nr:NAD(P)/FAD-dependent oxidoreductase [Liquorilactobacillus satsumensis]MCP9329520.1 NAD(P)/FAD-dependent oxidoreductase [Liquorilactobacillus satsumensis]